MASRRMAVNGSKQRERLVEAAAELLREEGYSALSARRVTGRAGLKSQLLYYYFETMDALVLAVLRRITERRQERFERALASPDPLREIWKLNSDPSAAILSAEFTSLAGHREAIRAEIVRGAREFRAQQVAVVSRLLQQKRVDLQAFPAEAVVMIATAVARSITTEQALGITDCHDEAIGLIERTLDRVCGSPPRAGKATGHARPRRAPRAGRKETARRSGRAP